MTSAPSIGFEYSPSRWPRGLLLVLGALAVMAILLSGVRALPAWLLAVAVAGYLARSYRQAGQRRVRRAIWRVDGGWDLELHDGAAAQAELLDARVIAGIIILRLGWPPRREAALLLFPDNLDATTRRHLRMRLSAVSDND